MEETWAKGGYEMLEMRMSGIEEEEGARHETGDLNRDGIKRVV